MFQSITNDSVECDVRTPEVPLYSKLIRVDELKTYQEWLGGK